MDVLITIVVHATAAATDAYDVMVPVQRFPTLPGASTKSVGAAKTTLDSTARGKASLENIILVNVEVY